MENTSANYECEAENIMHNSDLLDSECDFLSCIIFMLLIQIFKIGLVISTNSHN
jgi:hypothetical protein